jgi:FkbM family methyltransferase
MWLDGAIIKFTKMTGTYRLVKSSRIGSFFVRRMLKNNLNLSPLPAGIGVSINGVFPNFIIEISHGIRKILLAEQQAVYIYDLVNDFDYYFSAVHPSERSGWSVVDYSLPREHVLYGIEQPFFFTSLAEPMETTDIYLAKANLKEGDVVFDLGAYCGASVWAFSRAVGASGRVLAYEPDKQNFAALTRNIATHGLNNVCAENKGVWSSNGKLQFQGEGCMGSGILSVLSRTSNLYEVAVETLRDACSIHQIDRIDFIKMDIEGAEIEVVESSLDLLARYKPCLIIEPHLIHGVLATDRVVSLLEGIGYVCEVIPQCGLPLPLIHACFPS